ncbi:hypothetical protein like AT2G47500 [Hibiscus trionum]|uniref:Uncharacterized protein n=1 Tax=Hibiscus trionum TaxID=183268 RepID=A0A9W7HEG9_HIBTR|nr:hypothetical protein like AT2G47500 [Hibiscus trionum]
MAAEGTLSFSVASVVEDVLQQHGNRSQDLDLESRKAELAASRRYEAAGWLRKMVGIVAAKDLPAEPSEEEFRLGLRSGIVLCNVLNKVQPGAVPKVVERPCDAAPVADGAALSAYQYFENVRNFLVAGQELGLPTFEASDLEQGGKSARVVNCVLALKSYNEWKLSGGNGVWKFGGNTKPATTTLAKPFVRKTSEPFMNSFQRTSSSHEKSSNGHANEIDTNKMAGSGSLSMLVRAILTDKKPEEVPMLVESLLGKVVEEFEHRIGSQYEVMKTTSNGITASDFNKPLPKPILGDKKMEEKNIKVMKKDNCFHNITNDELKGQSLKLQMIFDQQQRDIQDLKHTINAAKAGMKHMQMKFHEEFNNLGMNIHGLAEAASGYHRVLEENRKLYNQVQDLKGSIRVYCRVRPFLSGKSSYLSIVDRIEDGNLSINIPSKNGKGCKSFTFNKVFGQSATQAEVFSDMQPLIRSVLDGYNVCIFAYGQTGSGKTYTMVGPKELTEKNQGVNYRALGDLFMLAEQRKDTFSYDVAVQMIEIYNEQVRDLLVTDGSNKRYPFLKIRNSSQTGLNVPDANLMPVSSTSDVIDLMNLGQRNRAVGATALNDRSSRSHSCLTVHVQGRDLTTGTVLRGCMHLVDLAGSERVNKSEVTGDRLKEAQHINKSLSALGDVISSLAQRNPHVPYRNSKLTQLLQDSLGGQAKTLMFVHISPEPDALAETISTLKFAERVATVELGAARVNKDTADVKELKEQIASLKAALARKDGETEQSHQSISSTGISEKYTTKATNDLSPFSPNHRVADMLGARQPMVDVGNIKVPTNTTLRQENQTFALDELLANSPPWPPVTSPTQNFRDDEKEPGSGEWVDKVMVNKHDAIPLGCWEVENGKLSDVFFQKYLHDSSNICPDQSPYNMFMGGNRFNMAATDDIDDLDAATSYSSEPDLLWQFNQSKLSTMANGIGIGSKTKKPTPKSASTPEQSKSLYPMAGPSPSRKQGNGVGQPLHRNGRQPAPAAGKRKTGSRK